MTVHPHTPLKFDNLVEGETIHQRCVIVKGTYIDASTRPEAVVVVRTLDQSGTTAYPTQVWPIVGGRFKAIIMLSPGLNKLEFKKEEEDITITTTITVNYVPLLQCPPLHLAVMLAADSPLLIDCPPFKHSALSTAHSSLDAAIAKFRMTAYMWQALTAEDNRMKGLGRRSFRLEEEWTADTTSSSFVKARHEKALSESGAMRSTAKVHLIRTKKTVEYLQDPDRAQQNPKATNKDDVFDIFMDALRENGPPFESSSHPIVAGLILDSHYSLSSKMIVGHAALGCHQPQGISLGMFGSHLTYSWPRFLEEVSSCLLDTTAPGDTVGNDCGDCETSWEACSIGQGAFLHEVGHAFGAPHTSGIMARGYARHWPKNFLTRTAYCSRLNQEGFVVIDGQTENEARWDIQDALMFRQKPHFWLPGDEKLSQASPIVELAQWDDTQPEITVDCAAKIGMIQFNDWVDPITSVTAPVEGVVYYNLEQLEKKHDRDVPLKLTVLGMNGKVTTVGNLWRTFHQTNFMRIPGTSVSLKKQSVVASNYEGNENPWNFSNAQEWDWAVLLSRMRDDGTIQNATKVDIRTGCILDGAYVYFGKDRVNCGPVYGPSGRAHTFGGHASEEIVIPSGEEIVKLEVSREGYCLHGVKVHLTNGVTGGALSGNYDQSDDCEYETLTLEPASSGDRIVGFYGRSLWNEGCAAVIEFGIITAPKDFKLPNSAYELPELQNIDGGVEKPGLRGQH